MMDALTLDIGGTKTSAAWWRGDTLVSRREAPTPRSAHDIVELVAGWVAEEPLVMRLGAAITGTTDGRHVGALNRSLIDGWDGYPLADRLESRLGVPTLLLNDAQAAAWGEFSLRDSAIDDLLFITASTGLGGGLVIGRQLRTGTTGLAGHVGHMLGAVGVGQTATQCSCGRGLCLERLVSGRALEDAMTALRLGRRSARDWLEDGQAGAAAVASWLVGSGDRLAQAIADVHALIDLQCVVVGGGLGLHPRFMDSLRQAMERLPLRFRVPVEPASLGADAGLRGMALWLNRAS